MASFRTWDNVAYPHMSPQGSTFSSLPSRNPQEIADTSSPAYQNFAQSFRQKFNHKRGLNEAWMTMSDEERRAWGAPSGVQNRGHYRPHLYESGSPPPSRSYYRTDKTPGRSMTPSERSQGMPHTQTTASWHVKSETSSLSTRGEDDDTLSSTPPPSADVFVTPTYPSSPDSYLAPHQRDRGVQQSGAFATSVPAYAAITRPGSVPAMHAPVPVRPAALASQSCVSPGAPSAQADWSRYMHGQSHQMPPRAVPHASLDYERTGVPPVHGHMQAPAPDGRWQYQPYPPAGHGYTDRRLPGRGE